MKQTNFIISLTFSAMIVLTFFAPNQAFAHCDCMDGPVVKAAQKALATGNVNLVLIWVQKQEEVVIRKAFEKTLAVRTLSPEARELADRYFFETLVRVHRAGEGAPYTGLKPAGCDLGPAVRAVDQAFEVKSVDPLLKLVSNAVESGIKEQFKHAMAKKDFDENNIEAGREYVKAYVIFMHYAKGIYDSATGTVEGHFPEASTVEMHKE